VSRRALLKELARQHRIISISLAAKEESLKRDGMEIHTIAWPQTGSLTDRLEIHRRLITGGYLRSRFLRIIKEAQPGLIFTDGFTGWAGVSLAKQLGAKSLFFNHDFDGLCPDRAHNLDPLNCGRNCFSCTRRWGIKLAYPLVRTYRTRYLKALQEADLVIANSHYTQDVVRRFTGIKAEVSYPIIDPDCPGRDQAYLRDSILFVKPVRPKGAKLVLDLARSLKEYKFIVLGRSDDPVLGKIRALPNVSWMEFHADMPRLYARARAVIVPSLLPETFGRVAAEAMACGAVPLVSNRGALPEAVAGAGIVLDPLQPSSWEAALKKLFTDQAYREELSQLGLTQARNYGAENIMASFRRAVSNKLGLDL